MAPLLRHCLQFLVFLLAQLVLLRWWVCTGLDGVKSVALKLSAKFKLLAATALVTAAISAGVTWKIAGWRFTAEKVAALEAQQKAFEKQRRVDQELLARAAENEARVRIVYRTKQEDIRRADLGQAECVAPTADVERLWNSVVVGGGAAPAAD